jgi:anti-sigma B factor antagonist
LPDLPEDFAVQTSTFADAVIVTVSGEVDLVTAPDMEKVIETATDPATRVVVDLSAVTVLDSTGLHALIAAQRELKQRGVWLSVVVPPDSHLRRAFEITRLIESLSVVESVGDALGGVPAEPRTTR